MSFQRQPTNVSFFDQGATTNDTLVATDATAGLNIAFGDANIESISGTDFDDVMSSAGEDGGVVISGRGGNDLLQGGDGHDIIYGGTGDDTIDGGLGNDVIRGEAGDDQIDGGGGGDMLDYKTSLVGVNVNIGTGVATDGYGTGDLFINVEHVSGSAFDDVLVGD